MAANLRLTSLRNTVDNDTSFLESPLKWTSHHLEQMKCRFEDVETTPVCTESTETDENVNHGRKTRSKPKSIAEELATCLVAKKRLEILINILVGDEPYFLKAR
jgi:hypothetical protein